MTSSSVILFLLIHSTYTSPFSVATICGDNDNLEDMLFKPIVSPIIVLLSNISLNCTLRSTQMTYTSSFAVATICDDDANLLGSLKRRWDPNPVWFLRLDVK